MRISHFLFSEEKSLMADTWVGNGFVQFEEIIQSWVHGLKRTPAFPCILLESWLNSSTELILSPAVQWRLCVALATRLKFPAIFREAELYVLLYSYMEQCAAWWVNFFSHSGRNDTTISPSCRATSFGGCLSIKAESYNVCVCSHILWANLKWAKFEKTSFWGQTFV